MNQFEYEANGQKHSGFFSVYQNRQGAVMLVMWNKSVPLSLEQIESLGLSIPEIHDFDAKRYMEFYYPEYFEK